MIKPLKALHVFFIMILLLTGCGTVNRLSNRPAYIKFVGNTDGVTLLIDGYNHGLLEENSKVNYTYKYTAGLHQITLLRDEVIILRVSVELKKGKFTQVVLP